MGYRAYCENLCGGYIDRPDPSENPSDSFESNKIIADLFRESQMIQALRAVWPVYPSAAEMQLDLSSQVFGDSAFHEFIEVEIDTEMDKIVEENGSSVS